MNPLIRFEQWFSKEKECNKLKLPAACCLTTIGLDGYPNARFVSLKEILNDSYVITGSLNSRKGIEIENSPKAALTFWWAATERQVRIQGDIIKITKEAAVGYFEQRNRDSKIVSTIFDQGKEIDSIEDLQKRFDTQKELIGDKRIKSPENWGGIAIKPIRIEFMNFKKSRLHERTLYKKTDKDWEMKILQP